MAEITNALVAVACILVIYDFIRKIKRGKE
jgi:hypothetical protein